VTWASNGIALPARTVPATTNADYFVVTPRSTNQNAFTLVSYTVIAVTANDGGTSCTTNNATGLGGAAVIRVNPNPTVSVSGSSSICDGSSTVLRAGLTGLGGWSVTWASNGIALPPRTVAATTNADYFVVTPRSSNQNIGTPVTYTVITVTDTGDTTLCSTNRATGIDSGALIMVNPGSSVSVALGATNISALMSNQNLVVWATNIFGTNVQIRTRSSVVVTQSPGGLVTGVISPSLTLSLTNQVNFAGGTSWHAVWQTISADRSGGSLKRILTHESTTKLRQMNCFSL